MTTRCCVARLIRTLSTVISTMCLTPSFMARAYRVSDVFIVHPSEVQAQIVKSASFISHGPEVGYKCPFPCGMQTFSPHSITYEHVLKGSIAKYVPYSKSRKLRTSRNFAGKKRNSENS